jgi:hypothetical protein
MVMPHEVTVPHTRAPQLGMQASGPASTVASDWRRVPSRSAASTLASGGSGASTVASTLASGGSGASGTPASGGSGASGTPASAGQVPQLMVMQPSSCMPHLPAQGLLAGVQPQTPVTPPPPQLSRGFSHAGQVTMVPQLLVLVPQPPFAQVSSRVSGTQALHCPVSALQPWAQPVPVFHWPFAWQVCAVSPLQRLSFGTQLPPHCPVAATQTNGQVISS